MRQQHQQSSRFQPQQSPQPSGSPPPPHKLVFQILRAVLFLLGLSAIVNLFYYSHLPVPTTHQETLLQQYSKRSSSDNNLQERRAAVGVIPAGVQEQGQDVDDDQDDDEKQKEQELLVDAQDEESPDDPVVAAAIEEKNDAFSIEQGPDEMAIKANANANANANAQTKDEQQQQQRQERQQVEQARPGEQAGEAEQGEHAEQGQQNEQQQPPPAQEQVQQADQVDQAEQGEEQQQQQPDQEQEDEEEGEENEEENEDDMEVADRKIAKKNKENDNQQQEGNLQEQAPPTTPREKLQLEPIKEPPPVSPFLLKQKNLGDGFWRKNSGKQIVKKGRKGKVLYQGVNAVRGEDLAGIADHISASNLTIEEASIGREPLLEILRDAGVQDFDAESIAKLPTWEQVVRMYGEGPVIYGLETCEAFRKNIPADDASIGPAGLFNTGTNPLNMYLSANCKMPHSRNRKTHGMRWQVPWGKHMLASRRWNNTAIHEEETNKANVLPIVMIRDPYSWMQSMCRHPYRTYWAHTEDHCPNLIPTPEDFQRLPDELTPGQESFWIQIGYPGQAVQYDSMAHFWSLWYREYINVDFPRLIVRFEDLIFYPKKVMSIICSCAGAVSKQKTFLYVVGDAKWGSRFHTGASNLISAMVRYGSDHNRLDSFTKEDLEYSRKHLDPELMQWFQYHTIGKQLDATLNRTQNEQQQQQEQKQEQQEKQQEKQQQK